jgi:GNAT superfamily N-acetyltransferase
MNAIIRPACEQDMDVLLELCEEHAAFEHASFDPSDATLALIGAMSGPSPRLWCWIAEMNGFAGYASATVDFSTWRAREFMHMDCLYVREGYRGSGIGSQLFDAIRNEAMRRGIDELQWQTPEWNSNAATFYQRLGAWETRKRRYRLSIP